MIYLVPFVVSVLFFMLRSQLVFKYRMKLISKGGDATSYDISQRKEWRWRFEALDKVSYMEMILRFWRRFDSFYPDKSFLNPQ